jgi:hypothetical protein
VKRTLSLLLLALPAFSEVEIKKAAEQVVVTIDGKPLTSLFYGADKMKPFLHPLHAQSGTVVTRALTTDPASQESKDHPHHQGIWFNHGDVNGLDFWGKTAPGPKAGRILVKKLSKAKGGKDKGEVGFVANWVDPDGKVLLVEQRRMIFHQDRSIDFDIVLTAQKEAVKFGDTKEGSFAIRLADAISEKKKGGSMVSSTGAKGMANVWGKPFPWVDYSGQIGNETVGVAIFDHPGNPKHPTTWHARDYGLFAANVFGLKDFKNDKSVDGSISVEPGKTLRFRYRVFVHSGDTTSGKVAEAYQSYTASAGS